MNPELRGWKNPARHKARRGFRSTPPPAHLSPKGGWAGGVSFFRHPSMYSVRLWEQITERGNAVRCPGAIILQNCQV